MYDTIYNDQFPAGPQAVAGYVDGALADQPNYNYVVSAFPRARHLSIALSAGHDADALDVEPGAASPVDFPQWYARQKVHGAARPCVYASVSAMREGILPMLAVRGIPRAMVRLWTAHYGTGEHICGPGTCRELSIGADGTQWRDNALGRILDQSLLRDGFFGAPVPSPAPVWQEAAVQALPVVTQGSTDTQAVRTLQGLLCARGHPVTVDGDAGPATVTALKDFQVVHGLVPDGAAGAATWPALLGVA
jgi:hypothetical protein